MATTTTIVGRAISQSQEFWHTDANCFQEKGEWAVRRRGRMKKKKKMRKREAKSQANTDKKQHGIKATYSIHQQRPGKMGLN